MLAVNALVVDDSRTAITVLKSQLSEFDVVVESAPDGSRALEALKDHHPDVIFLDHVMPGMDGFQVLQKIRANEATKNIPVVMYTSQSAPMYIKEARTLGAIDVIPKNVTQQELAEALNKAELFRLTAANDDFALPPAANDAVAPIRESLAAELKQIDEMHEPVKPAPLDIPNATPKVDTAEPAISNLHPAALAKAQSPSSSRAVPFLLALLIFFWGNSYLNDQRQEEAIASLQAQLIEQDKIVPQMRAEMMTQQKQLGEHFSNQLELLAAILTQQPTTEP